ncbi:DUF2339 domain-containing protein [uncultured Alteromonas sp.]|jgi:uncharacterized membrane protein|uniref:DUF2339 domain-containing protein n=1 Tax=uncultured Alteromonas sp. TaxID=179113 RepID=UPI0025E2304E|nr:DUF2339 domain-containing protein [uncultured Alteromonas sp.]
MDWLILVVFIGLFLITGAILSFSNRSTINELRREIKVLQEHINLQARQIGRLNSLISSDRAAPGAIEPSQYQTSQDESLPETVSSPKTAPESPVKPSSAADSISASKKAKAPPATTQGSSFNLDQFIRGNGLLWLGGLVLAMGGIFLARYSIEAGLLSPQLRVIVGTVFGVSLVGAADYLFRHRERFHIHSPYVCAALASGGVITCFAMVLVAYDFYDFIGAQLAFGLLAVVSLVSATLALRFGPLLAWIGVCGAYAVPALVNTGSGNVAALLLYTALVSASAIWIAQSVRQTRLWWLSFLANFGWLVMATFMAGQSHFYTLLLFTLVSVYLFVLSDLMGWSLRVTMTESLPVRTLLMPRKEHLGVMLPVLALAGFLAAQGVPHHLVISAMVLSALFWLVPARYSALDSWAFLGLGFLLFVFIRMPGPQDYSDNLFPFRDNYLFAQVAAWATLAYSGLMYRIWQRPAYLLLLVLGPMSMFALSYALATAEASEFLYPVWAIQLALIAIGGSAIASRVTNNLVQVTLSILANTSITLCMTMLLDAATLTLAIAIQIGVMSYLSWKLRVQLPDWLFKMALMVVAVRLTCAPWLDAYAGQQIVGVHWTLVIYPLVLGILWFSRAYNESHELKRWLEGAFLHVLALFVTTETTFWLVGHYPDFTNLSFREAALLALNWFILSAVYWWRASLALKATRLYQGFGLLLAVGAGLLHVDISVLSNPFIQTVDTGSGLLINWLLILWAIPAVILLTVARLGLTPARSQPFLYALSGILSCFYINGVIRGAYNGGALKLNGALEQAELYTYSIVWLLLATAMIFFSQYKAQLRLRNIGFGVLALVILKAFLVDMAHLEGLYRAVSFIGLGLSLVGIGWLFQKLTHGEKTGETL